MSMSEEMINRFAMHPARSMAVKDLHTQARNASALFASVLLTLTTPGREQSLALTKIEEAMFWATASIARDPANDEAEGEPTGSWQPQLNAPDPLEGLSPSLRDQLPFVIRDDMSSDKLYRMGHLHGKDGRCIRNRYAPLCKEPGKTEVAGQPKINIVYGDGGL